MKAEGPGGGRWGRRAGGKWGRSPQFSQLGQQYRGEVRLWGDGRKWGRAQAGWVTWAFVGRWWEAPPWPLALNAKQRCHCLASAAAADACAGCFSGNQEQKQTTPPLLSSSSSQAYTHAPHHPDSRSACTSKTHTNILHVGIPMQQKRRPDRV